MEKVTGIGGLFIKAKDINALAAWYQRYLGIEFGNNTYIDFKWVNKNNPAVPGHTVFSFFNDDSNYFNPSEKPFMINFRVHNLEQLLEDLKKEGIQITGNIEVFEYGKFGWIMDPEGNKIELWEPLAEKL